MKLNNEQIDLITNYFKENEKKQQDFKLGAEFEYFVIDKLTLNPITYDGDDGVLKTLEELMSFGYEGIYENKHLLGLKKGQSTITLEPGCQLEISIKPELSLHQLEKEYKQICFDIITVLEKKNQVLISSGYRVQSKMDEINMIPKQRYAYMYEYFKTCGPYAHHMMKQTASTQVTIDYENELDYQRKYRILNALSPVFYAYFDNAPIFEDKIYPNHSIRSMIWDNCDSCRCGILTEALTEQFGYESYAQYILNQSVIFKDNLFMKDRLFKDSFNPMSVSDLEHALSMVFPDVRTRKFIEIRMMDSLPYPLNFSVIALFKGLFYDIHNLNELYHYIKQFDVKEIINAKKNIVMHGIYTKINGISIYDVMKTLVMMAYKGLPDEEKKYLVPLSNLIQIKLTPQEITKNRLNLGKVTALEWCMIKQPLFWEDYKWMQAV